MNILLKQCIYLCVVFTIITQASLFINPISFISDYPPEIQERYYQTQHKQAQKKTINRIMIIKKIIGSVLLVLLFSWMAHRASATTLKQGTLYAYLYIFVVTIYDIVILDWLLFAKIKRIRLPGTEDMDEAYAKKWFHVKVVLPVIPLFLIAGLLVGALVSVLW